MRVSIMNCLNLFEIDVLHGHVLTIYLFIFVLKKRQ